MLKYTLLAIIALVSTTTISAQPHFEFERMSEHEFNGDRENSLEHRVGLLRGGHFNGPSHLYTPEQQHQVHMLKEEAKNVQRIHSEEVNRRRLEENDLKRLEERKGLTEAENKKLDEIERLQREIRDKQEIIRLETERANRLEADLERNDPLNWDVKKYQTQEQLEKLVDKVSFRSIKEMFTDPHGNVNAAKEARLAREMPEYKTMMEQQRRLVARYEKLRAKLLPDADLSDMILVQTTDDLPTSWGPEGTPDFAIYKSDLDHNDRIFQQDAILNAGRPRSTAPGTRGLKAKNIVQVTEANKKTWIQNQVAQIQTQENAFNRMKLKAIRDNIAKIENEVTGTRGNVANNEQELKNLEWELKRSKEIRAKPHDVSRQNFGAEVNSVEEDFKPKYESPKKAFHHRKNKGVHVEVDVAL